MKNFRNLIIAVLLFHSALNYSQQNTQEARIKISGTVIEKLSKLPLEYATITLTNSKTPKGITGGITNAKGEFDLVIAPGVYDINIEFISFTPISIKQKKLVDNTNLGQFALVEDATQLSEVVVRAEQTNVAVKLDKKVYSIGNDLMVKGGTVSDVLDNIPSVSVDADGTVSLRGNENVKILIDGKPTNAIDLSDALRQIPAESLDKVEVITNPSARYDAAGGAGILNIVIKKGKNLGFNGSFLATTGSPKNNGASATLNYKTKKFNLYTTQGLYDRNRPGNALTKTKYLNPAIDSPINMNETQKFERTDQSYSGNLGIDLFLNNSTTWSNVVNYRTRNGDSKSFVNDNYIFTDVSKNYLNTRNSDEIRNSKDFSYVSTLQKKFKKEGHILDISTQISSENDDKDALILDTKSGKDVTKNIQTQNQNLFQADYVLPFGKDSQFEAGYRGSFANSLSDVGVTNNNVVNTNFTNKLEYVENVNAIYSQYGFKVNKFSYLFGLRWEDSNIEVNQITDNNYNNKRYNNFFPSAFLTYEFSDENSISLNYSRRINRPDERMLNPFNNYSSNINIFRGNPNLDPAMTDSFDLGFLRKWSKFILSSSIYTNRTTNNFMIVSTESGVIVNGVPEIITSPINLATQQRTGFEFNLNFNPNKKFRLNTNFNLFNIDTKGDYSYTNSENKVVSENFDKNATTWSAKMSSKVTLPAKIDWQTNFSYSGDQKTAYGKTIGVSSLNLGFSKDVLKEKATIALTVDDVFNSRKRKMDFTKPEVFQSYSEMQFRERQITLSVTYRFNRQKTEKEKQPKRENDNGGDDYPG